MLVVEEMVLVVNLLRSSASSQQGTLCTPVGMTVDTL